ncbi:hypothetical protein [Methylobacterium sp. WL120]|uniref:hypothetical protein n=1 Tax=Methylobacterium sp. WL120 TaxID=2603887 RepID=UPI0011CA3E5F|nr:hypothetical protein [Methylobacterium sp. WL120]TXM69599.1 hypothetical protein FV229_04445 [Methylobacterium sp. WL120]
MMATNAAEHRIEVLRLFKSREWMAIPAEAQDAASHRAVKWLVGRGWLEADPVRFLTDFRITDTGYDVLASAGGDVTGWG